MSSHFRSPRLTNHSSFTIFWKAGLWPPVDCCEQSDERLRKVPNYGVNVHHRKAIVQFVGKKSDVFINLPTGYGKSNGGFKGRDSLPELSSDTRSSLSLASLWLRQRFPAVSSSFELEMASVCCLCYLYGLLANLLYFLSKPCHRRCEVARSGGVSTWMGDRHGNADWIIQYNWRTEVAVHSSRRSWGRNRCVTSSERLRRRLSPPELSENTYFHGVSIKILGATPPQKNHVIYPWRIP